MYFLPFSFLFFTTTLSFAYGQLSTTLMESGWVSKRNWKWCHVWREYFQELFGGSWKKTAKIPKLRTCKKFITIMVFWYLRPTVSCPPGLTLILVFLFILGLATYYTNESILESPTPPQPNGKFNSTICDIYLVRKNTGNMGQILPKETVH